MARCPQRAPSWGARPCETGCQLWLGRAEEGDHRQAAFLTSPPPKGAGVPDGLVPQRHGSQARWVGKTGCLSGRRRVWTGSARTQNRSARRANRSAPVKNGENRSAERRINRRGAESLVLGPVFMPGGYQRRLRRGRQPKTFGIGRLPARPPAP